MMKAALEITKWGCWSLGAAGLFAAYGLYSYPAHLEFASLLSIAGAAAALVALGFAAGGLQKSKLR
jgi:hypothetical protein